MSKTFPWNTVGGYDFYEVLSALQKTIRRGEQDSALFWSTELYLSEYESHAWRRLLVIASEDVGIADAEVFTQVRALYDTWMERKKEGDAKLFFVDAVLRLVLAKKSRITDNALVVFFEGERPKFEIPNFALDIHTNRGRELGRTQKHFFEEGARLENSTLVDPYERDAKEIRSGEVE